MKIKNLQYKNCNNSEELIKFVNKYFKLRYNSFYYIDAGGYSSSVFITSIDEQKGIIYHVPDGDPMCAPIAWKIRQSEVDMPMWAFPSSIITIKTDWNK